MPAGAGAKMTMDYVTPTGSLSPASAVKSQFCQTIEAATIAKNASSQASINSTVVPAEAIKNEQIFKAAEAKTETGTNAEYAKNGMPCVAEICLGDGIAELKKVKWDKAQKQAVNKYLLEYVNKNFRGNLKSSMPYLRKGFDGNTGVFDNQALTNLSEVTADCATQSYTLLSGYFTSRGGNLTNVIIRLLPAQDNTTQKWTVITIDRTYKTQSEKQNAEVVAQLKDRYSTFPSITSPVKEGAGQVYVNANQLMMTTFLPTATERARLHPACGGAEKVNIN